MRMAMYRALLLLVAVQLVLHMLVSSSKTVNKPKRHLLDNATNDKKTVPFPRWQEGNISLSTIIMFLEEKLANNDHFMLQRKNSSRELPEVLYAIDNRGVWTSRLIRNQSSARYGYRFHPTERMFQVAHRLLQSTKQANISRWESLQRAVDFGGFPFLSWYGDYTSCNYHNWGNKTIPLFTTCANVMCHHTFPSPTYLTTKTSHNKPTDWERYFAEQGRIYPWESKIRKVVWRGSLSGPLFNFTSPRWRIGVFGARAAQSNDTLFDIGITSIPSRHKQLSSERREDLGKPAEPIKPMSAFQRYLAILDIDGNSWSSRFGSLLCYNSVVLKVEPSYVDYFHFKYLQPWVHYIPVKADLSDLTQQAAFALDPRNEATIKNITASANQWCHDRMVKKSIAEDVLDVWDAYVQLLDRGDLDWGVAWQAKKDRLFSPQSYDMVRIRTIS